MQRQSADGQAHDLVNGLGELDVVVLVDGLPDKRPGPSSLGVGVRGHQPRPVARGADDPSGPDGRDAVGLCAYSRDLNADDVLDAEGRGITFTRPTDAAVRAGTPGASVG